MIILSINYHFNHGSQDQLSLGTCSVCEVSVNDHIKGFLIHLKVVSRELQQVQLPRLGEVQIIVYRIRLGAEE